MKVLDRYVLGTFLKNYLISFLVLVGLFIVLHMVLNFDELARNKPTDAASALPPMLQIVWNIADFYFWQIFLIFVHLSGMIPVVAAAFTLIRLSRFNELVAVLSAGVPLLRVALPIILAGLILSLLVIVDQEVIIPRIIPKLERDATQAGQTVYRRFPVAALQDDQGRILTAGFYRSGPGNPRLEELSLIERDAQMRPVSQLKADSAEWDWNKQQWSLSDDAVKITGLRPDQELSFDSSIRIYKSSITPDELILYWDRDFVTLLSTAKINQLLQQQTFGRMELLKVKHARFTQWLMNLILLMLGISCVLTREPGRLRHAAVKSVVLTGSALGMMFAAQQIAPPADQEWMARWPIILAWLPVFIFGPLSIWLLDRVKT